MGSKVNEFYWQHKNNKNHGDFICFRPCTTPPSWRVGGVDHSFISVWWAHLSSCCRYNRLDCLYLNAGIMPNPQLDMKAFLRGLFSRCLCCFEIILHLSDYLPPHASVSSPSQPHCQHVCDRWGHPDAEGRAHCWRPAGSVHNQPLRTLPASESRWIVENSSECRKQSFLPGWIKLHHCKTASLFIW